MPVASPVHDNNPSQPHVSEEGEIPQSKHQASPTREVPNVLVPPLAHQPTPDEQPQQTPVPDSTSGPPVKESAPSQI